MPGLEQTTAFSGDQRTTCRSLPSPIIWLPESKPSPSVCGIGLTWCAIFFLETEPYVAQDDPELCITEDDIELSPPVSASQMPWFIWLFFLNWIIIFRWGGSHFVALTDCKPGWPNLTEIGSPLPPKCWTPGWTKFFMPGVSSIVLYC